MPKESVSLSLPTSAVDLTRACCSGENYDVWIAAHGQRMGSPGIANYLAWAAQVLEEESYRALFREEVFSEYAARETLADILMASAPLGRKELQAAVQRSLQDARTEVPGLTLRLPPED